MTDTTQAIALRCPSCGGQSFEDVKGRQKARCRTCGSMERSRVARLFLDKYVKPQAGMRMLHCAPEKDLSAYLKGLLGDGYEPADINPALYMRTQGLEVRPMDLCVDAAALPTGHYDLVMHNHVLEHVPCNWTVALTHLHRAVKPGGVHLFSVPMSITGYYREDLNPEVPTSERVTRYQQGDHMRRFGRLDIDKTLGAIFPEISPSYSLLDFFTDAELLSASVPDRWWTCSGASLFMIRKPLDKG